MKNNSSLSLSEKEKYISFILDYLTITQQETLSFWHNPGEAEIKNDKTPVTELDRHLEEILRELVCNTYPDHGVIGEEFGNSNLDAEFQWIVDPIDGTMNLVERIPTFGTMIALCHRGTPILGAIDHPVLGIRHFGGDGIGVWNNEGKLPPFEPRDKSLTSAIIGVAAPTTMNRSGKLPLLQDMTVQLPHLRIFYDCFAHSMCVSGGIAANLDYGLKIWDLAAAYALIQGRGGVVIELGEPWNGDPSQRIGAIIGQARIAGELHHYVEQFQSTHL